MEITPHTGVHRCQFHVTRQAQVVSGGQGLQLGLTAGSASTWAEVTRPKVAFVSSAANAPLSRAASSFRRCRHSVAALLSACSQLNICRPPCGPMLHYLYPGPFVSGFPERVIYGFVCFSLCRKC